MSECGCCYTDTGGGGGSISEITGSGGIAITNPNGPTTNVDGSGLIRKYTIGPAFTNAEFLTPQDAVDQAVIDGNATGYGGAVFEIYPDSYGAVVIPETLPYWHIVGLGDGGNTGPFLSSITATIRAAHSQNSIVGVATTNLNVSQPGTGGATNYLNILDVWIFNQATITGPDLRAFVQDCHWYGGSGDFTFDGLRVTVRGCEFTPFGNITLTGTDTTRVIGNDIRGQLIIGGPFAEITGNQISSTAAVIVDDQTTATMLFAGNTIDFRAAGPISDVYQKSGASVLDAGGNNWSENIVEPYLVTAGTRGNRSIDVERIIVNNDFSMAGKGPGSAIDVNSFGDISFGGTASGSFTASGFNDLFMPSASAPGSGLMIAGGYQQHILNGDQSLGSQFIGVDHRVVNFTESGGLGELFLADNFENHSFLGTGGAGDFDISTHRSFIAVATSVVGGRFDAINHETVNFEGDAANLANNSFLVSNYRNWTVDFSGAVRQESELFIETGSPDTQALIRLDNSGGANGAASSIFTGTRDPNGLVTAPAGSLYMRSTGELWQNTDGVTAWVLFSTGSGGAAQWAQAFSLDENVANTDVYYFMGRGAGNDTPGNKRSGANSGIQNAASCSPYVVPCDCNLVSATMKLKGAGVQNGSVVYPVQYRVEVRDIGFAGTSLIGNLDYSIDNSHTVGTFSVGNTNFDQKLSPGLALTEGQAIGLRFMDNGSEAAASQAAQMLNSFITLLFEAT